MENKIRLGFFIIAVHDYANAQYGAPGFPDCWGVAARKYCHCSNIDKLRKFESFVSASKYVRSRPAQYKKERTFQVLYVYDRHFYDVASEEDAAEIDLKISRQPAGLQAIGLRF